MPSLSGADRSHRAEASQPTQGGAHGTLLERITYGTRVRKSTVWITHYDAPRSSAVLSARTRDFSLSLLVPPRALRRFVELLTRTHALMLRSTAANFFISQAKFLFRHRGHRTGVNTGANSNTLEGRPLDPLTTAVLDQPPGRAAKRLAPPGRLKRYLNKAHLHLGDLLPDPPRVAFHTRILYQCGIAFGRSSSSLWRRMFSS